MTNSERPHKRSPKEIIEETQPANVEHVFARRPGEEVRHIAEGVGTRVTYSAERADYHNIHTHPLPEGSLSLQSPRDLNNFLSSSTEKFSTVAVRDPNSGTLMGYSVLKKTKELSFAKDNPLIKFIPHVWELIKLDIETTQMQNRTEKMMAETISSPNISHIQYKEELDAFLKKYGLKLRLVPAEGYEVSRNKGGFTKKEA